jgi:hypothetical protein
MTEGSQGIIAYQSIMPRSATIFKFRKSDAPDHHISLKDNIFDPASASYSQKAG